MRHGKTNTVVNLERKLESFADQWAPKVVAELNDYQFKLVKLQGEFVWHNHESTDEAFLVLHGDMTIEFRNGSVPLSAGDMYVVPRGVDHKPTAEHECHVLLVEPRGVVNTGDEGGSRTAESDIWI
jgi:mannose-6-phosphate isomerase-like protein (cupin superfamily)